MCVYTYIARERERDAHMHIYIYREREKERERERYVRVICKQHTPIGTPDPNLRHLANWCL